MKEEWTLVGEGNPFAEIFQKVSKETLYFIVAIIGLVLAEVLIVGIAQLSRTEMVLILILFNVVIAGLVIFFIYREKSKQKKLEGLNEEVKEVCTGYFGKEEK